MMLIDVMMPEMDGGELASVLPADPASSCAGHLSHGAHRQGRCPSGIVASGGQTYLPKPIDLDKLMAVHRREIAGTDGFVADLIERPP